MWIEQGFGRFEEGEEVDIEITEIDYTKSEPHKPFARCKRLSDDLKFNVNINKKDTHRRPGRYKLKCDNVNEIGYCYVSLQQLPHSSWDVHDGIQTVEQVSNPTAEYNDMIFDINLTIRYKEKLTYTNEVINDCLETIEKELYACYGRYKIQQESDEYDFLH